jgi:poly(A) polymerase
VFGRDWGADAARRDFTMNALYADREGRVLDPLGGLADLLARRVRFIGDARQRIREDALRILRFFRFAAEYGAGEIDQEGLVAAMRERRGLDRLSRERVRQELLRLLTAPRAPVVVGDMAEAGLLLPVLKGVPRVDAFRRLVGIEAALDLAPGPVVRLAALGVRVEEDADRLSETLRLTRRESAALVGLAGLWRSVPIQAPGERVDRFLYDAREGPAAEAVLLAWAVSGAPADDPAWRRVHTRAAAWRPPLAPFKGADLVALGLEPGPEVGKALARLEAAWVAAGFPEDPGQVRRLTEEAVGRPLRPPDQGRP